MMDENPAEKMLRICAEDPMYDKHAEVSKSLLLRAADELATLRKDAERYRSALVECAEAFEALAVGGGIDAHEYAVAVRRVLALHNVGHQETAASASSRSARRPSHTRRSES